VLAVASWLAFDLSLFALSLVMARRKSGATASAFPAAAIGSSAPKARRLGGSRFRASEIDCGGGEWREKRRWSHDRPTEAVYSFFMSFLDGQGAAPKRAKPMPLATDFAVQIGRQWVAKRGMA
jgi:hypothetical protein